MNLVVKKLIKNWHWPILIFVAIAFFIGAASFNYYTQSADFVKWLSPDETANYNFAKLYAQQGELTIFEKYNILADDILRPRSFRSDDGYLKPVSFLGLILIYGKIAQLATYKIIPFLTPLAAALGIIFYYLLIKEIFGKRNALLSAFILAVFPPFIYYSARSMFHNTLFVVFLVISLYFVCLSVKKSGAARLAINNILPNILAGLGGAFLGLAVIVRSSELIWLAPVWLAIWLFNIKKFGFIKLMIFTACLLFAALPALYWNKILYQSYWRGGYEEMNQSVLNIAGAGAVILKSGAANPVILKNSLTQIKNNFFHFGWQPLKSLEIFYFYFIDMFYWVFWPALFGLFILFSKVKKRGGRHYGYIAALFISAAILVFYYGSWDFYDNPDPESRTIGNSYVRYWLPLYLGAIPLAVIFFLKLSNIFKKKILIYIARALIIFLVFFISFKFVLWGSDEGLVKSARQQIAARAEYNKILSLTEAESVVITQYHDKLLFPERKVIFGLFDDLNMIKQYAVLASYLPLYYYNFTLPERDFNYLNNKRLVEFGLKISEVEKVGEGFTLYRLSLLTTLTKGSLRPKGGAGDF